MRTAIAAIALPLALAACQERAVVDPDPETTIPAGPVRGPASAAPETNQAAPSATSGKDVAERSIPQALQGNWGMTPADCTSTRGDNKGLLRVTATTLQFYESLARLGEIKSRSDAGLTADFAFSGEGMTWNREETLSVSGGTLTRTEKGGDEPGSVGPFTYARCATGTGAG